MSKTVREVLKVAALGGLLVVFQAFAFSEPSQAPPGGNVAAPVNVGNVLQEKAGAFVATVLSSRGSAWFATDSGNVGIGTINPTEKLDVGSGKVSANDYWIAAINTWASELKFVNQFVNVRSKVMKNDAVVYCPAAYPVLIACDTTDDEAPLTGPTSLAGYCESDGECTSKNAAPSQFQRHNLGDQMTYHERVKNSAGIEGCWAYDLGHAHQPFRLEISCVKK